MGKYRIEKDSLGEVQVPEVALYGAQTQRAVENFNFSGLVLPRGFIRSLGLVKAAAARANGELGLLGNAMAESIATAALAVARGAASTTTSSPSMSSRPALARAPT
jgi:fumarate hydratase class II